MNLSEMISKVREENLTKQQMEDFRDELAHLYSLYQLEMAVIKKAKALFLLQNPEKTNVATENKWAVTKEGQREIDIKYHSLALKELLSSIKHRLFSTF